VISRRLRLSFLNAQAALEALPSVVDIMAEELHWNAARKQQEMVQTTRFLQSMGLPPGAAAVVLQGGVLARPSWSLGWLDWAYRRLLDGATTQQKVDAGSVSSSHGRAQFEAGEADALRDVFVERARDTAGRLAMPAIRELLQGIPNYAGIRSKDFEYVLEETGLAEQKDIDVEEFVEVRCRFSLHSPCDARLGVLLMSGIFWKQMCAELKDVSFAPLSRAAAKKLRRAIPVEKSGGGV